MLITRRQQIHICADCGKPYARLYKDDVSHSNDTIRSVCVAHSICVCHGTGASVSFGARHPEHLFKHNG